MRLTLDAAVALVTEFPRWSEMLYSCDSLGFVPRLVATKELGAAERGALAIVRSALRRRLLPYVDGRGFVEFGGLARKWAECGPRVWDCEGPNPRQASASGECVS